MERARWLTDDEQRAWRGLMVMQDHLGEYLERQLRRHFGISNADYHVLAHLSEADDGRLRSFELAALLRWEKSRLSQQLSRMERRGLVTKERCPTDQRGAVAIITQRGADLIATAARQHVADVRNALIDHLTPAQLTALVDISEIARRRIDELERDE
jgi:DNA-binding MarR family transcriptional regulator